MELDLTAEQEAFRDEVHAFAREVLAPRSREFDHDGAFPVELVKAMGDLGLFGVAFPRDVGGRDGTMVEFALAVEEVGAVDQSFGITLASGVGLGASMVNRFGNDEQRRTWLPSIVRGEALGAFGLTEPQGGSDARRLRTTARLDGDEWVLDGEKAYITNSGSAITTFVCAVARTEDGDRSNASVILVPAGTQGMQVGPDYSKLGWHASDTHPIVFRNCRVPAANLVGERGRGFHQALEILDGGRITVAALSIGLARACLEHSLARAHDREAFGRPIGAYEAIQFKLADMRLAVETARLLTLRAAWLRDQGRPYRTEAAMAKLYASEAAVTCTRDAVQIHGGLGFMDDSPVARLYREGKILEIAEGTSEVLRMVIAKDWGFGAPG